MRNSLGGEKCMRGRAAKEVCFVTQPQPECVISTNDRIGGQQVNPAGMVRGCLVMSAKFHIQYSRQAACQFGMNRSFVIRFPAARGVDQDRTRGGLTSFLVKAHFMLLLPVYWRSL